MKKQFVKIISMLLLMVFCYSASGQSQKITVPLRFDHYYTYEQVVEALKALNQAYPQLTKLDLVGKSEEDREIWALTINNPKTGDELSKPGVYVDGNIHGNEIQAGEVCLYFLDQLLTKYGKNDKITELVDRNAYYVIPVVNVDGRYHFFTDGNTSSSNRGLRIPKDDDRDGLFDEDFPDDLNGDGSIGQMRKKDPLGQFKTDPDDPRLMVRVKPGETGEWTLLGMEGIDNDGDGLYDEDSEGYVDGNRNWGYNWAPKYVQSGAGDYPFSGTGTKAIAKYLTDRQNIIVSFAFHNTGGMFVRGPGTSTEGEYPPGDVGVYDFLGENAEKIVPGYEYVVTWKDMYSVYGGFNEFVFSVFGSYGFVGELFMREQETFRKEDDPLLRGELMDLFETNDARTRELMKFNDHLSYGELYTDWEPYNHPTYGEVEIGGWVKFSGRLPHPFMLQDLVHRNAAAIIFAAGQTPKIKMEVFETKKISNDLFRIRVRLTNENAIPSMSYHSVQKKVFPQDMLKVNGNNIKVVLGGRLTDQYHDRVSYKEYKPGVHFMQIPGYGRLEYQFLISGKGQVSFNYESLKAGKLSVTTDLK